MKVIKIDCPVVIPISSMFTTDLTCSAWWKAFSLALFSYCCSRRVAPWVALPALSSPSVSSTWSCWWAGSSKWKKHQEKSIYTFIFWDDVSNVVVNMLNGIILNVFSSHLLRVFFGVFLTVLNFPTPVSRISFLFLIVVPAIFLALSVISCEFLWIPKIFLV